MSTGFLIGALGFVIVGLSALHLVIRDSRACQKWGTIAGFCSSVFLCILLLESYWGVAGYLVLLAYTHVWVVKTSMWLRIPVEPIHTPMEQHLTLSSLLQDAVDHSHLYLYSEDAKEAIESLRFLLESSTLRQEDQEQIYSTWVTKCTEAMCEVCGHDWAEIRNRWKACCLRCGKAKHPELQKLSLATVRALLPLVDEQKHDERAEEIEDD